MKLYTITLYANADRSDMPGYRQWAEAEYNRKVCATWNYEPTPGKLASQIALLNLAIPVIIRTVKAHTGTGALICFNAWYTNGYPDSYLGI